MCIRDRPLPFGKGKIIWGTPVTIKDTASDADIEDIRQNIESEMNKYLAEADYALGHALIEPETS